MEIYKKLNKIQVELKAPKDRVNKFGGFSYRNCEDILNALKPLLDAEGCAVILNDDVVQIGDRFYIKATATLFSENGENISNTAYAREPLQKKGADESQITGASSSYARKYALNGLFLLDDSKDADSLDAKIAEAKPDAVMIKSLRDKTNGDKKFEEYIVSVKLNGGDRKSFDDLNIGQVEYLIRNWEKLLVGTPYEEKK
jgi:hypothetical protein